MIPNLKKFLSGYTLTPVTNGKSGAKLFFVGSDYVLKTANRDKLASDIWDKCVREVKMYEFFRDRDVSYAPQAIYTFVSEEKTELLLPRGKTVSGEEMTPDVLERMLEALVTIHHSLIPKFLETPSKRSPIPKEMLQIATEGWLSLLSEHPGAFETEPIHRIAETINEMLLRAPCPQSCLTHGDFHRENLLRMDDGQLLVCDWQGVGVGEPAGDLSFFQSRLQDEGYHIDLRELIERYCTVAERMGYHENPDCILRVAQLSNLTVSFQFWHEYLHNSTKERVAGIYNEMVKDFEALNSEWRYGSVLIKSLTPDIFLLNEPRGCTAFLIIGEEKACLLDTMEGEEDIGAIVRMLTDKPLTVINTHGHPDHVHGNLYFDDILIHPADRFLMEMFLHDEEVVERAQKRGLSMPRVHDIRGGDVIDLGKKTLKVYDCPGHTPGGIFLLLVEDRILFSGDAVNHHCWLQLEGCASIEEVRDTITKLFFLEKEADRILHSHAFGFDDISLLRCFVAGLSEILEGQTQKDEPYFFFGGEARKHTHVANTELDREETESIICYQENNIYHKS